MPSKSRERSRRRGSRRSDDASSSSKRNSSKGTRRRQGRKKHTDNGDFEGSSSNDDDLILSSDTWSSDEGGRKGGKKLERRAVSAPSSGKSRNRSGVKKSTAESRRRARRRDKDMLRLGGLADDSADSSSSSSGVVSRARAARQKRQEKRDRKYAAIVIQSYARMWVWSRRCVEWERDDYDAKMKDVESVREILRQQNKSFLIPVKTLFILIRQLIFVCERVSMDDSDVRRFSSLCKYLALSAAAQPKQNFCASKSLWKSGGTLFGKLVRFALWAALHGTEKAKPNRFTPPQKLLLLLCGGHPKEKIPLEKANSIYFWCSVMVASPDQKLGGICALVRSAVAMNPKGLWRNGRFAMTILASCYRWISGAEVSTKAKRMSQLTDPEIQSDIVEGVVKAFLVDVLTIPTVKDRIGACLCDALPGLGGLWLYKDALRCLASESKVAKKIQPSDAPKGDSFPHDIMILGNILNELNDKVNDGQQLGAIILLEVKALKSLLVMVPDGTYKSKMTVIWGNRSTPMVLGESVSSQLNLMCSEALLRRLITYSNTLPEELAAKRMQLNDRVWEKFYAVDLSKNASTEPSLRPPPEKTLSRKLSDYYKKSSWGRKLRSFLGVSKNSGDDDAGPSSSSSRGADARPRYGPRGTAALFHVPQGAEKEETVNQGKYLLAMTGMLSTLFQKWAPNANNPRSLSVLNAVAFGTKFSERLWMHFETKFLPPKLFSPSFGEKDRLKQLFARDKKLGQSNTGDINVLFVLTVFCVVACHVFLITEDSEVYGGKRPLHRTEYVRLVTYMKGFLYEHHRLLVSCERASGGRSQRSNYETAKFYLGQLAEKILSEIYNRHSRKPMFATDHWLIPELNTRGSVDEEASEFLSACFRVMPYTVPFSERVRAFRNLVSIDRDEHQPTGAPPTHRVRIRRTHAFNDGFAQIFKLGGAALKSRLYIVFVNKSGNEESGIDAGGLFKEFWTTLSATAFSPKYGLFKVTPDELLYPNYASRTIHGPCHLDLFEFMGRVVAKALYENVLLQPKFAYFFLSKFLGKPNYIGDLPSLDFDLYKNLNFLKEYEGDVADLCLSFAVTNDDYGSQTEIELIPGGGAVEVENHNKLRYVHLMADYHLNKRAYQQTSAFMKGFFQIIPKNWIEMFSQPELQVLISGSLSSFSVKEMRDCTKYRAGYTSSDVRIQWFWKCVFQMSKKDRGRLLKFVTSCSRPPLLGFSELHPPFQIQRIPIRGNEDRLPTASTCFNTLKLPAYKSEQILKEKLLYAIRSGAGFELT